MSPQPVQKNLPQLDLSDVAPRVGQRVGGGQLLEPCTPRWAPGPRTILAFWAGNAGMVRHSKMQFRGPSFAGDVTYVEGEVTAKEAESAFGVPLVSVKVRMANQDGVVLVDGLAELELPLD